MTNAESTPVSATEAIKVFTDYAFAAYGFKHFETATDLLKSADAIKELINGIKPPFKHFSNYFLVATTLCLAHNLTD